MGSSNSKSCAAGSNIKFGTSCVESSELLLSKVWNFSRNLVKSEIYYRGIILKYLL